MELPSLGLTVLALVCKQSKKTNYYAVDDVIPSAR